MKLGSIIKFLIVGGIAGATGFLVLWFLVEQLGIHYLVSIIIASLVSISTGYLGNLLWTFKSRAKLVHQKLSYPVYVALYLINLAIIQAVSAFLVEIFDVYFMIAVLGGNILLVPINYLICKRWIFKRRKALTECSEI